MLGNKLEMLDAKINEKAHERATAPRGGEVQSHLKDELSKLRSGRDHLASQQSVLKSKLQGGSHLSPSEERR
jgi:hypothetical protein